MKSSMRNVFRCILFSIVSCLLSASHLVAAEAKDLAGKYKVEGVDPSGNKYDGVAEVEFKAGDKVDITWKIGKRTTLGVGRLVGDTLTVQYKGALADRQGNASYQVMPLGRLVGRWRTKGVKGVGKETLIPQK